MHKVTLILSFMLVASCQLAEKEPYTIEDAWVREAPPNASVMAGYVTITNNTKYGRTLTFAKSKQFNAVEIHRTIIENGVAKMLRQDNLPIPTGKSLKLVPGSYHLMLMSPKSTFKANDEVVVTFCLVNDDDPKAGVEEVDITMLVQKR